MVLIDRGRFTSDQESYYWQGVVDTTDHPTTPFSTLHLGHKDTALSHQSGTISLSGVLSVDNFMLIAVSSSILGPVGDWGSKYQP